jgi:hypothetical protein
MKGPDRLPAGGRVQDEASSVAPVLNLHTEFVVKIAAFPEQVDHDPGSLPVPEMIGSADHFLHLQLVRLLSTRLTTQRPFPGGTLASVEVPSAGPRRKLAVPGNILRRRAVQVAPGGSGAAGGS